MIGRKSIFVHIALLATSAIFAIWVWTRDKEPKALVQADVTVWPGRASDVERIAYEGKKKKLDITAKEDKVGRYFQGTLEKEKAAPKPAGSADPAEPPPAGERTTIGILSVTPAAKLADLLGPLKAIRAVGPIAAEREAEFGLSDPEGTLSVWIHGTERKLQLGGLTPGAQDRYARDLQSKEVFVVKGDIFRNVDAPEGALVERDLHEWKDADVASIKISATDKTRELVRGGPETKRFWADPTSRETADETAANWMAKVDRLRPSEYPAEAPEPKEVVCRIDYAGSGGAIGFLEIVRGPAGANGKPEYFVRSERTRIHAKVPASAGEQVEQDLGSVLH